MIKNWDYITVIGNHNEASSKFLYGFPSFYEETFSKVETKIKQNNLTSPWIAKEIIKLFQKNENFITNFLKREQKNVGQTTKPTKI